MKAKVAFSKSFLESYSSLPKKLQKKAREFTEKFQQDPTQPGINFERLAGAVDDKVIVTSVLKFAGTEKMLAIPAILRNVHTEKAHDATQELTYYHGLEFDIKDQQDVITLHGFVYENIVKSQSD